MTDDRLTHLLSVAPDLWPSPHRFGFVRGGGGSAQQVDEYLILPSHRAPRLLTPARRRTASAVVRAHGSSRGLVGRIQSEVLAAGLQMGAGALLSRRRFVVTAPAGAPESLVGHLSEVLGRQVVMGMPLTAPRANRKPVLHVLGTDGRTVAFVKLGVDPLTDSLVQQETAALQGLTALGTTCVVAPRVLHAGVWGGHPLLVQSPLSVPPLRRMPGKSLIEAGVAAVAGLGRADGVRLGDSSFWPALTDRAQRLPAGEAGRRLRRLLDRVEEIASGEPIAVGASHGDWAPWNMARRGERLLVWDWERFREDVPVGFDLLHHRLQQDVVVRGVPPLEGARRAISAVDPLRPLGQSALGARVVGLLYGTDLAVRYLADRQQEAGATLGDVGSWLLPALDDGLQDLEDSTS